MRLRLDLAYDGTGFSGWARQPGLRTVQGELERALTVVLRRPVQVVVAGRTDAGVHARGQVCHVDLPDAADKGAWPAVSAEIDPAAVPAVPPDSPPPEPLPPFEVDIRLLRRLNGVLPDDVRVRGVLEAPPGFDARFSATWRRYSYRVTDGVVDPLRRRDTLLHPRPLDLGRMRSACPDLLGLRDFAAFCKARKVEGATTIRTLQHLDWRADGDALVMDVRADAFCHSMVRALVGSLLLVGDGRREPGWPAEVLAGRVRRSDSPVAPPQGLVLEQVGYPDDADLAVRATETRRPRDLSQLR